MAISNAKTNSDLFQNYSWNIGPHPDVYLLMTHNYTQRCYLLSPFKPILISLGSLYLLYSIMWITLTFSIWKLSNHNIQKWLSFIPVYKTIWLL